MTPLRRTTWWIGAVATAVALCGCRLPGSPGAALPSVAALEAGDGTPVVGLPSRSRDAAYRPVGAGPDSSLETTTSGPALAIAEVAPAPVAAETFGGSRVTGNDDWAGSATTLDDQSRFAAAAGSFEGADVVRGQSPDAYGGHAVAQLPPGSPQASGGAYSNGGATFVPAGSGVNPTPTTVYQPAVGPPASGGVPVLPVFQPPFVPETSAVQPDSVVDIDLPVQETQTGKLMVGAGINSDAGLVGNIVIDEQNFDIFRPSFAWNDWVNGTAFRGGGQRFRLELMPGTEVQRYSFNFTEPYLLNMPVSFGVSGFFFQRAYTGWNEERLGGRLSLGYLFPDRPDLSLTTSIGAERVTITNPSVPTPPELTDVLGNNDLYTARVQLAHDTRDSSFLPTQGHYVAVSFEEGFGSFTFPVFEVDGRKYFVMRERPDGSGRHILGVSGKFGISGSDTPLFEHFFAGGFSSIRGFAFRGASPRQDNIPVGGDLEILTSIEYRFPMTQNDVIYGSFFCDAGTVEPSTQVYGRDFRVTPGFELRINVPALGPIPIAVGLGVPVHHAPGDQIQNFHFFVGVSR